MGSEGGLYSSKSTNGGKGLQNSKLIVISPHDSIKCQSWGGFEKIAFYHYKKAHFYTVGQNQLF